MMDTDFLGARLWRARTFACLMVTLIACSLGHAQSGSAQVTGSVTYRERMALPSDAIIDVKLLDATVADVASQTVAESLINAEGRQVPVPFTLGYDPTLIVPAHRYSVRATIRSGDGMLMFSSTQAYPVITHGAPAKVNLVLQRVGHGAKPGGTAKKQPAPAISEGTASDSQPAPPPDASESVPPATNAAPPASEPAPPSAAAPATAASQPPAEQPPVKQEAEQQPAAPVPANPLPSEQPSSTASARPSRLENAPAASEPAPTQAESAPSGNNLPASETANQPSAPANAEQPPATQAAAPPEQAPAPEPPPQAPAPPVSAQPAQPEALTSGEAHSAAPETAPPPPTSSSAPAEPAPATSDAKAAQPEEPLPEAPSASKSAELASRMTPPAEAEPAPEPDSSSRPERPAANKGLTPLADTQWRLVQLGGEDVMITPPQRPVTLSFSPEGRRIGGSAGCNSYLGTFTDEHGKLQLHPGSMTMMFCADPVDSREKKFIAMLRSADGYKMNGSSLQLTHNGKVIAKFINNPEL